MCFKSAQAKVGWYEKCAELLTSSHGPGRSEAVWLGSIRKTRYKIPNRKYLQTPVFPKIIWMLKTKANETIEHKIPFVLSRQKPLSLKRIDSEALIGFLIQSEAIFLRKFDYS